MENKKILSLAMFVLMMTSCAVYHTNVIKNIENKRILIEDVENHQERIIVMSGKKRNNTITENLQQGDTLWIQTRFYDELVFTPDMRIVVYFNSDSIDARIRRKQFEAQKQEMLNNKVR